MIFYRKYITHKEKLLISKNSKKEYILIIYITFKDDLYIVNSDLKEVKGEEVVNSKSKEQIYQSEKDCWSYIYSILAKFEDTTLKIMLLDEDYGTKEEIRLLAQWIYEANAV